MAERKTPITTFGSYVLLSNGIPLPRIFANYQHAKEGRNLAQELFPANEIRIAKLFVPKEEQ